MNCAKSPTPWVVRKRALIFFDTNVTNLYCIVGELQDDQPRTWNMVAFTYQDRQQAQPWHEKLVCLKIFRKKMWKYFSIQSVWEMPSQEKHLKNMMKGLKDKLENALIARQSKLLRKILDLLVYKPAPKGHILEIIQIFEWNSLMLMGEICGVWRVDENGQWILPDGCLKWFS